VLSIGSSEYDQAWHYGFNVKTVPSPCVPPLNVVPYSVPFTSIKLASGCCPSEPWPKLYSRRRITTQPQFDARWRDRHNRLVLWHPASIAAATQMLSAYRLQYEIMAVPGLLVCYSA